MNQLFLKIFVLVQNLKDREDGQDLVEYVLTVSLVALGAVAGLRALAVGVANSYNTLSTTLQANV